MSRMIQVLLGYAVQDMFEYYDRVQNKSFWKVGWTLSGKKFDLVILSDIQYFVGHIFKFQALIQGVFQQFSSCFCN